MERLKNEMDYIRMFYGVPAKRGGRIRVRSKTGTILGAAYPYLRIRFDGEKRVRHVHPEWRIEYLEPIKGETRVNRSIPERKSRNAT
jgi:hypothetical protein